MARPKTKIEPLISLPDRYIVLEQRYLRGRNPFVLCRNKFDGTYWVIGVDLSRASYLINQEYPTLELARSKYNAVI